MCCGARPKVRAILYRLSMSSRCYFFSCVFNARCTLFASAKDRCRCAHFGQVWCQNVCCQHVHASVALLLHFKSLKHLVHSLLYSFALIQFTHEPVGICVLCVFSPCMTCPSVLGKGAHAIGPPGPCSPEATLQKLVSPRITCCLFHFMFYFFVFSSSSPFPSSPFLLGFVLFCFCLSFRLFHFIFLLRVILR